MKNKEQPEDNIIVIPFYVMWPTKLKSVKIPMCTDIAHTFRILIPDADCDCGKRKLSETILEGSLVSDGIKNSHGYSINGIQVFDAQTFTQEVDIYYQSLKETE